MNTVPDNKRHIPSTSRDRKETWNIIKDTLKNYKEGEEKEIARKKEK